MKKQNFVKITKGHAIITIHFENLKGCFDAVQNTKKAEKNEKELSGSSGKHGLLALSTLLQTLDGFRLDVVEKTFIVLHGPFINSRASIVSIGRSILLSIL